MSWLAPSRVRVSARRVGVSACPLTGPCRPSYDWALPLTVWFACPRGWMSLPVGSCLPAGCSLPAPYWVLPARPLPFCRKGYADVPLALSLSFRRWYWWVLPVPRSLPFPGLYLSPFTRCVPRCISATLGMPIPRYLPSLEKKLCTHCNVLEIGQISQ